MDPAAFLVCFPYFEAALLSYVLYLHIFSESSSGVWGGKPQSKELSVANSVINPPGMCYTQGEKCGLLSEV